MFDAEPDGCDPVIRLSEALTWRELLPRWGRPTPVERLEGIPKELADFLAAGGSKVAVQNRFHAPMLDGDWAVFMVENQAVFRWAIRTNDPEPDPAVYVCEADSDVWSSVEARLGAFLSAASMIEAVFRSPARLTAMGPAELVDDDFLGLPALSLPDIGWEGLRHGWHGNDQLLAFTNTGVDVAGATGGDGWVYVGADDPEALVPRSPHASQRQGGTRSTDASPSRCGYVSPSMAAQRTHTARASVTSSPAHLAIPPATIGWPDQVRIAGRHPRHREFRDGEERSLGRWEARDLLS